MRTIGTTFLACVPAAVLLGAAAFAAPAHGTPVPAVAGGVPPLLPDAVTVQGPSSVVDPLPAGTDESWWEKVTADLQRAEYSASPTSAGLQAPNRAHNLRTLFGEHGFDIVPRSSPGDAPAWRFAWQTSAVGRSGRMLAVTPAPPQADGARVTYRYDGWSEWYENSAKGLEQGFTIEQRPEGEGPLRIAGSVSGRLEPRPRADGAIDFFDDHGASVIRYGELHAWDARSVELPAKLELAADVTLSIVIDDHDATYPLTIDPLMTSPAWTAEPDTANSLFGHSVATAGDVNGDGYSDVIVGAWGFSNAEGRAFVYHGSASGLSLTPNWTAEGDQATALFGYSVAAAGDVNGDGFDDVIVGAIYYDNGSTNEGRALVYHGSALGLSLTPDWTAESDQALAELGTSVATAGDVNGDGFSDVIVGARQYSNGHATEGGAFVYHGSASGLSPTSSWTGEGGAIGVQFGVSVSTAGDVNGDGFSDVIVGAWLDGQGGRAFVYHGSDSGLVATAAWAAEANQGNAYFGTSVATAGDVNGDGFADVIIGAPGYTNGQSTEGRTFVYHGSAGGLSVGAAWTAESNQADNSFGLSVGTAGDVNGDGFADVIVGNKDWTNGQFTEGRADVYSGSAAGLTIGPTWAVESDQASAQFGVSVATAGDVNGDGYSDVIVGAEAYDNPETDEGRAFVYRGSAAGLATAPGWTTNANQAGAEFGYSVSTAGDVNGDGFSDVIVGARLYDNGQTDEGRAFVYLGSPTGLGTGPLWTAEGDSQFAEFGTSVAAAGDVNGDGYGDVIVGAPYYFNANGTSGRALVYHGSPAGPAASPSWTSPLDLYATKFGECVSTAGDVNGDGYSDVIVGDSGRFHLVSKYGAAFVYHGSATGLTTTPTWIVEGSQAAGFFGASVSTAGDVNGDGFSDVVVGSAGLNHATGEGRVFVHHGSPTGLDTAAAWTADGDQVGGMFGYRVSTAGDVNGDGYSDIIVGADAYSNGQPYEGRAFLYEGSAAGLGASAAWTAESDQTMAALGRSVGTAGDVNGDGFSDVIVGIPFYSNGQSGEGRALVYHGSSAGVGTAPAWTVESDQVSAVFGNSAAAAGDVNGDGYGDVIVGAPTSTTTLGEGQAFVYYGNAGDGLDQLPGQARTDGTAPISLLGASDSPTGFLLKALGRTPAGRSRVRLQFEVKPVGIAFDGSGIVTGDPVDSGAPLVGTGSAAPVSELATGLTAETPYHWRLRVLSDSPFFPRSRWLSLAANGSGEADLRTAPSGTSADDVAVIVGRWLEPGAPNPFAAATQLAYTLPNRGRVRLAVFDASGRRVAVLADEVQSAGRHIVTWDGRGEDRRIPAAGVYFARLQFGGRVEGRKLVLIR
jgi:hypothetical protein